MEQYIGTKIIHAEPATQGESAARRMHCIQDDFPNTLLTLTAPGYHVVYPDGYQSWSPKDVFEEAYRPTVGMSFGLAIEALKKGKRVARKGWNGRGIFLELQIPDAHSKMTLPYIYIVTNFLVTDNPDAPKGRVPWLASQTDMLTDDWYISE